MTKLERMKELTAILDKASKAYYQEDKEILTNIEYDALYDELQVLEQETGTILNGSPTQKVGYEVLSELTKVTHEFPMLSLDKTKDREALVSWTKDQESILSWKLDGLTTVLTYENGSLKQAVTRGNGYIGEDITNNAKTFVNIPQRIAYKGKLVVRGESVITYTDFYRINSEILDVQAKYKNPRNLCSGTVRQLNNQITAKRNVHFFAFHLIDIPELSLNTVEKRFQYLKELGFDVVEYEKVTKDTMLDVVESFAKRIEKNDFPSDGLVLTYNDIIYGESLGRTSKFPRNSIAFKWADELMETELLEMEWSPSRTGLINPVAIFTPVELEGTTVSRASVHNISILEGLELGIGDKITVYKANMIIPQIHENLTKSKKLPIPQSCPVCGHPTMIEDDNGVRVLYCTNELCSAKRMKHFALFASRDGLNMEGLSEMTLDKLIEQNFLKTLPDLFRLETFKEEIMALEGFGKKSYDNLIESIEKSRKVKLPNFIYGLGILHVGLSTAKLLCKHFQYDFSKIRTAKEEELQYVDGIGEVIAKSVTSFFNDKEVNEMIKELLSYITFEPMEVTMDGIFNGKVFVITGSLTSYENRTALKNEIEALGGKVTGSVSAKTDYLINNDNMSTSSKNKKAKELSIPIITEEEYIKLKES